MSEAVGGGVIDRLTGLVRSSVGALGDRHPQAKWSDYRPDPSVVQFSAYLPWLATDPENSGEVLCLDGCRGYIWECRPIPFITEKELAAIEGLARLGHSEKAVLQFTLIGDPFIDPILDAYKSYSVRQNPEIKELVERYSQYLSDGRHGLEQLAGIPLRRFRLLVSLKDEDGIDDMQREQVEEFLKGACLNPRRWKTADLLDWSRRFFNRDTTESSTYHDESIPVQKQILTSDTYVERKTDSIIFSKGDEIYKVARCLTPKTMPSEVDVLQSNELTGGVMGAIQDSEQITTPFMYTLTVVFDSVKSELYRKGALTSAQRIAGSLAQRLKNKVDEFTWAIGKLEREPFYKFVPTMWVFGRDKAEAAASMARVKRIWESRGYFMQEDEGILLPLFMGALPLGWVSDSKTTNTVDRHFFAPSRGISIQAPVQADFCGGGAPLLILPGRKGEVVSLDIFDKAANNHNCFVAAGSGAGKSFFENYLIYNYYKRGDIFRILDIGFSYRRTTKVLNGRYIDVGESKVVINPFDFIKDIDYDITVAAAVIAQMIYSSGVESPSETEWTLIKDAVTWAYAQDTPERGVDLVSIYLSEFPKHVEITLDEYMGDVITLARKLNFNLQDYTSRGRFGKYVNGKSTLNIADDEFVVLELETLRNVEELFRVFTLQIINAVTQDLYLGENKNQHRNVIFDEAWQFLRATGGGQQSPVLPVIEEGYRRSRKYGGSFSVITQSILDMNLFGEVGKVIRANSAFKFYLQSSDYEAARKEDLIDYDPFTMELLKSVTSRRPKYSEIFVDSPFGRSVVRLAVDRYAYYLFTSDAGDNFRIDRYREQGLGYREAILQVIAEDERAQSAGAG